MTLRTSLITSLLLTVFIHSMASAQSLDLSVEWALNVGGEFYLGEDGIAYQTDERVQKESLINGIITDPIKGTQDATVFKTYQLGSNVISRRVESGYYDLIFKFAEPESAEAGGKEQGDLGVGRRVFNIVAEGKIVIPSLDITLARDGNTKSALVRMVSKIHVADGVLDINLRSIVGKPILNALIVRKRELRQKHSSGDDWVMTWHDEFDYDGAPDPNKWSYDIWPAKKVNDEDQAYTNRSKNVRVEDGLLIIEAHHENYDKAEYTSGRIHAAGKGDLMYGRVEVRAKLPSGQGTWPAIWMLPSDPFKYASTCLKGHDWQGSSNCDAWPNSGEIDIMEHVGYDMNRVHGTVHNRAYYWVNGEQRKASVEAKNVDSEFHVYSMEWSPERIDVFYDNALYFTYLNQGDGWQAWPYDHPFHLILNVAVGGGWGSAGGVNDESVFPTAMQVDYVRQFQKINTVKNVVQKQ